MREYFSFFSFPSLPPCPFFVYISAEVSPIAEGVRIYQLKCTVVEQTYSVNTKHRMASESPQEVPL